MDFRPIDEWDGVIEVSIGGHPMQWNVMQADRENNGGVVPGGMTSRTEENWNDQFGFELRLNDVPPVIRYWGDRVIRREDAAG